MVLCHAVSGCSSLSAALGSSVFVEKHWKLGIAQKQREGALLIKFGHSDCKVLVGVKKVVQKAISEPIIQRWSPSALTDG